jgi:hypothetical protein
MTGDRSSRERRRRGRRLRRDELAAVLKPPSAPLVWRARWPGRLTAIGSCVLFVTCVDRPPGGSLADPEPGPLFFAVWTSLVAAWLCCRLYLWRITADRDGVYIRRMWRVKYVSWSVIRRVELRHDGLLEFFGPGVEPMAGLFIPPWASRPGCRASTGAVAADTLTVMAQHARLRPLAQADRTMPGTAYARWALPLAAVLFAMADYLHR